MTPHLLLLLSLFPFVLSLPTPPSLRQSETDLQCTDSLGNCVTTVFLKDGIARTTVNSLFELSATDGFDAPELDFEIVEGKDVITSVTPEEVQNPIPNDNAFYKTDVVFNNLPGHAVLKLKVKDGDGTVLTHTYTFEVVGLVLYEEQGDERLKVTPPNPASTDLRPLDNGDYGTTVKVKSHTGDVISSQIDEGSIRLVVPDHSDILSLPEDCSAFAPMENVRPPCFMAFSNDFTSFSVRVGAELEFPEDGIKVEFKWEGIREFESDENVEQGVGSNGNGPVSLTDDIITFIVIKKPNGNSLRSSASLAGWKIGVIAITSVLLVLAALMLVCCYFCGRKRSPRKPEPDVVGFKDKFQEIGFLRKVSTFRRGAGNLDDDDECYVEEPPTPNDSDILMLENESRGNGRSTEGHIEGVIPNRLQEDKSVERLVLSPGVVRGVELESSAEGASAFGYGARSRDNDVTSYGRGMTSVPRDKFAKPSEYGSSRGKSSGGSKRTDRPNGTAPDYLRDSHERIQSLQRDRARIRELDREIEKERSLRDQAEEGLRPRSSEEEFPESDPTVDGGTNGVLTKSRGGVGAAINRIRQLDLLNGPASRGLVGRNGEPIRQPGAEDIMGGTIEEFGNSAVS